ncbi:MAG: class I SAM-dependent methyltransferase [Elusimicrobia bacterium]|nr:class I SAM-dependent methyltransferase [Elusimicrobiota bacterium]MDE2510371.1 class I SAM-dependent methyltransferase [Elusimicrobiota bacterium]
MTPPSKSSTTPWDAPGWVEFYETRRATTRDIYPSEWLFLKDLLVENVSVLDIGCALGGLASVMSEHLKSFTYTGLDVSPNMVERARQKHPAGRFHVISGPDLSVLGAERFDLVVCLGVLHLTRPWRELIAAAWERSTGSLLLDLRETGGATIEDETLSYYSVGTLLQSGAPARLPYNVVNSGDALRALTDLCPGAAALQHYGYLSAVSSAAVTLTKQIMMNTYRIDKRPASK